MPCLRKSYFGVLYPAEASTEKKTRDFKLGRAGRQAKAAALPALALHVISAKFKPVPDCEVFRVPMLPPLRNY